ncbi:MAG: methionine adenosyltransferase [Alphaproteobacteria bacterium]|nr:methionine adenosyltransferase [Alphaproteobacteria bacterium]HCQ71260.1 methionine adenosyltransferase [Rhodospirillaceae bacterium]|tara:strand:+ start:8463 stop:9686 length:1224 start_codon:yes stop_codon:yes gene_type:complete
MSSTQPDILRTTSPQNASGLTDYIFTSESVSEGHPDKVCDRISDTVLDLYLAADPEARVACEAMVTTDSVTLAGEVRGPESVRDQIEPAVRAAIKDIGYNQDGFNWETVTIENKLHQQSPDIAAGVDEGTGTDTNEGAGDQGLMFGYACRETDALMPAPIYFSHAILRELAAQRKSGKLAQLGPDAKTQVTVEYKNDKPAGISALVLSTQHAEDMTQDEVRNLVLPVIQKVLPEGWMPAEENIYINPTGRFVIGGPVGDAGLTGRKIIVDTYGGAAPHGGGAFSGKDPTKVDRSAAYAARYLAKNVVAAGLADGCTVQLAYAIGISKPISVYLNTHGTGKAPESAIVAALQDLVDLSPRGIRTHLQLNKPIYTRTAAYGHFGRTPDADGGFSWEKTDLVDELQKRFK